METTQALRSAHSAEVLLRRDHREVNGLFKEFENASDREQKRALVRRICDALEIHATLEEEIFYPACRARNVEEAFLDEAQVEHDILKVLIGDLRHADPGADFHDAKVTVLSEYVKHHVKEEERAVTGIFAKARQAGVDMKALGMLGEERKEALARQAAGAELSAPPMRAFIPDVDGLNTYRRVFAMAR